MNDGCNTSKNVSRVVLTAANSSLIEEAEGVPILAMCAT